ncbi:MAG: acylphosphatase [Actinomycetales bacterium]
MALTAVEVEVSGRVQGVGYRYSCQVEATRLGVRGWVRNDDAAGTVSGLFEGEQTAVDELVDWCRQGPPFASVSRVRVLPADVQGLTRFVVTG